MISPIQYQHLLHSPVSNPNTEKQVLESFEALLITQLVRGLREAMTDESEDGAGSGKGTYMAMLDQHLGEAISRSGGIGLRAQLEPYIHAGEEETASQSELPEDSPIRVDSKVFPQKTDK